MDVKKIVRCLPEQFQELLETGQTEVDGVIKTKEEGTLYDVGELALIEWHNKVMEEQVKKYEISHEPVAMKSLEQEYNDIAVDLITDENTQMSKYVSAVGYTAILKSGDTIKVTSPNTGIFFINGKKTAKDYTFTGEGCEVVNVWAFEGQQAGETLVRPPQLSDTPTFNITELDVRNISQTPSVGDAYKNYALTIRAYNFVISGLSTRKLISNGTETFNQTSIAGAVEEVESDCETVTYTIAATTNKTKLRKANFHNLKTIISDYGKGFLNGCTNPNLVCNFPKLKVIKGGAGNADSNPFTGVVNLIIPSSVETMTGYITKNNATITLNCNKAQSIHSGWCASTPTVNFDMCGNWYPSINIAVAAKNRTKDWFIDLFRNKLYDHSITSDTGDGGVVLSAGEITIPQAMFDALMADEEGQAALQTAEDKNWTVGGA